MKAGVVEICCDSSEDVAMALRGGANRIELCASLQCGGTTPSAGLCSRALEDAEGHVEVVALIRPRAGDFVYTPGEVREMERDILTLREIGLRSFAIGALTQDKWIDDVTVSRLISAAGRRSTFVFHRAIDELVRQANADFQNMTSCLDNLGFVRLLSSGGASDALAGSCVLAKLRDACRDTSLDLCVAGKVAANNIARLVQLTGATQYHAASSVRVGGGAQSDEATLFPPMPRVHPERVRQLVETFGQQSLASSKL